MARFVADPRVHQVKCKLRRQPASDRAFTTLRPCNANPTQPRPSLADLNREPAGLKTDENKLFLQARFIHDPPIHRGPWSVCAVHAARRGCAQWYASGNWKLKQSNGGLVEMYLEQQGNRLKGSAQRSGSRGAVEGTVAGNSFNVRVSWQDGKQAVYGGTINPQGRMEGNMQERQKPLGPALPATSTTAKWSADRAMTCGEAATAPNPAATPAPTPIVHAPGVKRTGRVPSIPVTQVPGITANPGVVTIPAGETEAMVALNWDAGSDHPYAEVWVQVDNQDETKIVEEGKGSRQVTVQPGKTYLYSLSDSGERLATVTVTTKGP